MQKKWFVFISIALLASCSNDDGGPVVGTDGQTASDASDATNTANTDSTDAMSSTDEAVDVAIDGIEGAEETDGAGSDDAADTTDVTDSVATDSVDSQDATDGADTQDASDAEDTGDLTDALDSADTQDGNDAQDLADGTDGVDEQTMTDGTDGTAQECGVDPLALTGNLQISGYGVVTFQAVSVQVQHKQNFIELNKQCITSLIITADAEPGCVLTVEAGDKLSADGHLLVKSVTFQSSGCTGLSTPLSGTWTSTNPNNTDHVQLEDMNVPAEAVNPICFPTAFELSLTEPLVGSVGNSLDVSNTTIGMSGEVISNGNPANDCPAAYVPPPTSGQLGCSDGTREGFISLTKYPKIAACGGAWDVPGVHNVNPACSREAGNDGINAPGTGCNVTDLCAEGWHVCLGKTDVLSRNPLGCGGIMDGAQSPAFFLARTSSVGAFDCDQDANQFGAPGNLNDLFGCGDLGCSTKSQKSLGKCSGTQSGCDPLAPCPSCEPGVCSDGSTCEEGSCFPLTLGSHNLCKTLQVMPSCNCTTDAAGVVKCLPTSGGCGWCKPVNYYNELLGLSLETTWDCGTASTQEANNVIKDDPDTQGGVMCCADEAPTTP